MCDCCHEKFCKIEREKYEKILRKYAKTNLWTLTRQMHEMYINKVVCHFILIILKLQEMLDKLLQKITQVSK